MTKYKICKFVDGNGKEWYQVKKKGWLFWRYLDTFEKMALRSHRVILKLSNVEEANKYIEEDIWRDRSWQAKKVECWSWHYND
jgi:hypothetical protein